MTAKEARELAEKIKLDGIDEIEDSIQKEALKGNFILWWYGQISNPVRDKLTSMGYDVGKTDFNRNEYITKISWL